MKSLWLVLGICLLAGCELEFHCPQEATRNFEILDPLKGVHVGDRVEIFVVHGHLMKYINGKLYSSEPFCEATKEYVVNP